MFAVGNRMAISKEYLWPDSTAIYRGLGWMYSMGVYQPLMRAPKVRRVRLPKWAGANAMARRVPSLSLGQVDVAGPC